MKTITIQHRSSHHAQNSGYHRLLDFVPSTQIPNNKGILPYRIAKFIGTHSNQEYAIYDSTSVNKDITLIFKCFWPHAETKIIHYLHAERDIRHAISIKRFFSNTNFFGTFHKPPEVLKSQIPKTKYLKLLDGIIAVGENQVDFLKNWLNTDQVRYIPHGIDTDFFKPYPEVRRSNTLLFVGQHLRDFEAFNYCIPIIAQKVKGLTVNVIMREDFFHKITPHSCVTLWNGVNDEDLKRFYQEASALFLPLIDSTACNSLLEALSCGTPIITTAVGGSLSYLAGTTNILTPNLDYDYLIEVCIAILKDDAKQTSMGQSSRAKALEYDWKVVAQTTQDFYNLVSSYHKS